MKLLIDHTYTGTTLDRFVKVYFSEDFNNAIAPEIGVRDREQLEWAEQEDGSIHIRTKVVPEAKLPRAVQRLIGDIPIVYYENSRYDPASQLITYEIEHLAQRHLEVRGTIRFLAVPQGVRRLLDGEVKVHVRVVRGLVERIIKTELERAFCRKAVLMQQYLDRRSGGGEAETTERDGTSRCG